MMTVMGEMGKEVGLRFWNEGMNFVFAFFSSSHSDFRLSVCIPSCYPVTCVLLSLASPCINDSPLYVPLDVLDTLPPPLPDCLVVQDRQAHYR